MSVSFTMPFCQGFLEVTLNTAENFGTFKRAEISLIFRVSDTRQSF